MNSDSHNEATLKIWIRDRIVILAIIIFIVGAGLYMVAELMFDAHSIWLHPLKEFSLLISMIGVVSLGYELFLRELTFKEYKDALQEIVNPDATRLGISGIYRNRSELAQGHTFETLFHDVKKEIYIGGTSLLSISTGSRDLLRQKVLEGINVKLLIIDPDSDVVELITKQAGGKSTFLNEINTSLLLLQRTQEEIDAAKSSQKGKLQVHVYRSIPSHSFIMLDGDKSKGLIIADIGPYLGKNHQRPSMMMNNLDGGMYHHYRELNMNMWEESQPFKSKNVGALRPTKAQVWASGKDVEFFDDEEGIWKPAVISPLSRNWRGIKGCNWIWVRDELRLEEAKTGTRKQFRLKFDIAEGKLNDLLMAELLVRGDDMCHVVVNNVSLNQDYGGADYPDPFIIDLEKLVKEGENLITFELICFSHPEAKTPEDNPTGMICRLHLEFQG